MPDWLRPADVGFDHHAAQAAIDAVSEVRFSLALGWAAEADGMDRMAGGWHGRAADAFIDSHRARGADTEAAASDLLALQRALEAAVDDATVEQRRVDRRQAQWDAERRAEELSRLDEQTDQQNIRSHPARG